MTKICDRNYSEGSMYTVKQIDGVGCCPSCEQPTICHNMPVQYRALYWALHGQRGISSEAIATHMVGISKSTGRPPSDSSDRGRCIWLLELIPEWLPRLDEMVKYDAPDKRSEGFIINSSGITADHNTWAAQIPKIREEGKL